MAVGGYYEGNFGQAEYERMCQLVWPDNQLPPGLLYHAAGPGEHGWTVVEIWESQEALDRFAKERLMPALQQAGDVVQPHFFQVVNTREP